MTEQTDDSKRAERNWRKAGLVVQAMSRFMRSVNPPITFGKPPHPSVTAESGLDRTSSGDSDSQKDHKANHRGHKAAYIFAPLAPPEATVEN